MIIAEVRDLIKDKHRGSSVSLKVESHISTHSPEGVYWTATLGGWIDPWGPKRCFLFGTASDQKLSRAIRQAYKIARETAKYG